MKRILTGLKPTGHLHLGNYFGGLKPIIDLSTDPANEVILMCADLHGLTDRQRMQLPGESTLSHLATYVTMGFNLNSNSIIIQSEFSQILKNSWYLSCATNMGLMERAHAYKDAVANGKDPTAGLFYYPILMASDILTFDADLVPVGKDQSQHIEIASDCARHFNTIVKKPVYKEPKGLINATLPLVPGLDGVKKMSKSYNNEIPLFAAKKDIEKRVKEIKTDSKGLDDVKNPEECAIFQIFRSFASPEALAYMKDRLEKGVGYGYGHAKKDFLDEHEKVFGSKKEEYEHYLQNPKELRKKIEPGYLKAHSYADAVTQRAHAALGLIQLSSL